MTKSKPYIQREGECPCCKNLTLSYGPIEPEGESIYYPWTCTTCKASGKEWYSIEFIEHTVRETQ